MIDLQLRQKQEGEKGEKSNQQAKVGKARILEYAGLLLDEELDR